MNSPHPLSDRSQLPGIGTSKPGEIATDFGRSAIRLTLRDWLVVGVVVGLIFLFAPRFGVWWEQTPIDLDSRIPYADSEDYWTFRQRLREIVAAERIPIFGDSVVWGDYVLAADALSSCLNRELGTPRFSNAGINGAHPLALEGLVDDYAGDVHDRQVILHCNLLWMSSPDRDLQVDKDIPINHARLIPQFQPRIPAYRASFAQRLGNVIDRSVPFFDYVTHLRTRYFDGQDLERWSLKHPYADPLAQFRVRTVEPEELRHQPIPWTEQGIQPQDLPWIELSTSLQWQAWRQTVMKLKSRRNRIFVLVGPLNSHLLTPGSAQRFHRLQQEAISWLNKEDFSHLAPATLPSSEYGDASHPLSAGYHRLAQTLAADPAFREWFESDSTAR